MNRIFLLTALTFVFAAAHANATAIGIDVAISSQYQNNSQANQTGTVQHASYVPFITFPTGETGEWFIDAGILFTDVDDTTPLISTYASKYTQTSFTFGGGYYWKLLSAGAFSLKTGPALSLYNWGEPSTATSSFSDVEFFGTIPLVLDITFENGWGLQLKENVVYFSSEVYTYGSSTSTYIDYGWGSAAPSVGVFYSF